MIFVFLICCINDKGDDMLEKLPKVQMFDSSVLKVSENIFYLKRGESYNIEGKTFLVLGGALSDDKTHRKVHESWWPQAEWSNEERLKYIERIKKAEEKLCSFPYRNYKRNCEFRYIL